MSVSSSNWKKFMYGWFGKEESLEDTIISYLNYQPNGNHSALRKKPTKEELAVLIKILKEDPHMSTIANLREKFLHIRGSSARLNYDSIDNSNYRWKAEDTVTGEITYGATLKHLAERIKAEPRAVASAFKRKNVLYKKYRIKKNIGE